VEEILDCRKRVKKIQYLVSWKGYGLEDNSWEKEDNLDNCRKAVADFNSRHPDAATKHQRRKQQKQGLAFSLRGFLTRPGGRMHSRIRGGKFSLFSKKEEGAGELEGG
jgi:hypothetical protein